MHLNQLVLTGYLYELPGHVHNLKSAPKLLHLLLGKSVCPLSTISKVDEVQNTFPGKLTRRVFMGELALKVLDYL